MNFASLNTAKGSKGLATFPESPAGPWPAFPPSKTRLQSF